MTVIERSYEELEALVRKHYENPDLLLIRRAYELAASAHEGETRLTGHPFVSHPLAVAYKLAEMKMHLNVVAAGLLHDIVEDTGIETEDLARDFGADIASLVDSVTKLKKVRYHGADRYVENMRKMFLAMASDVRVVFIKFADRLHNLQTLYGQPKHKQKRIARETLEIYAPIASRLGMGEMKGELEDLSFSYMHPKEYERVKSLMDAKLREKGAYVSKNIEEVEALLARTRFTDIEVHGRVKRLYSLWKKLRRYQDDISKIYDLIAVRIIVSDVEDCYAALGILHQEFTPLPGRVKDYIAQPKPNGYQSLHTTVFAADGKIIEYQIRSREMHELAEYGVAAHWRYKEAGTDAPRHFQWMEELAAIQRELDSKKDFLEKLEELKIDIFHDRIFVFTPKGDVIDLPEGATPIDFAYAIHTDIGNKCTSARVNDRIVGLNAVLQSGDICEIVVDKNRRGPNPDWLKCVKTRHAREKIKDAAKHNMKTWLKDVMKGREKKTQKSGA